MLFIDLETVPDQTFVYKSYSQGKQPGLLSTGCLKIYQHPACLESE